MFYSQFILAKKGPLGTIWIAAHLERKLRKNQVADTDIGVSVDSIIFPDVPIALRLSSHLLLGVVRIYNRKVGYLFDDCSEALLKVKQAFRSTAVDLPPEESKAPYHSITLPEKFDLDDFELPDSDIYQGNYVDHHISSREQITLQDTMESVNYSTSKFGLDERFGDGGASGLDLDEELFLNKVGAAGDADESADPQSSDRPTSPLKADENLVDWANNPEIMADRADELADLMDYAQAPRTPRLVEEPNLSNAKDASACDDHPDSEYHLMHSTVRENGDNNPHEDKQEVDWCSRDGTISDAVLLVRNEENGHLLTGLGINESNRQRDSPLEGQDEGTRPISEFADGIKPGDAHVREDLPTEVVKEVNKTDNNHQGPSEVGMETNTAENSGLAGNDQQVAEGLTLKDLASTGVDACNGAGKASNLQEPCDDGPGLVMENHVGSYLEAPETQACQETTNSMNLEAHDKDVTGVTILSGPCNSAVEYPNVTKPGDSISSDADVKSDVAALAIYGREERLEPGQEFCNNINPEDGQKENQVRKRASGEDAWATGSEVDTRVHNPNSQDRLVGDINNSMEPELPAPEKLLSVPEDHVDSHRDMLLEVNTNEFEGFDIVDAGGKSAAGRKRSFTESTLTEQSLNSAESSRQVRARTAGSIPDDDDLLSSILVGRKSSILKVKATPPLTEVTSLKRGRAVPRSSIPKRKALMDDTMVLHGDTIRHQLTNTEDIRRVRKKAPCSLSEISVIQKQCMEDEFFVETVFTGMAAELASLHSQPCDLSHIMVCKDDVNVSSLETLVEARLLSQDETNLATPHSTLGPNLASLDEKSSASLETVAGLHLTSTNNESHDKGPADDNVTETSEQGVDDQILIAKDNETTGVSETPPQIEIMEGVNDTRTDRNFSKEPAKPTDDVGPDASLEEVLVNAADVGSSTTNAVSDKLQLDPTGPATKDVVQTGYLDNSGEMKFSVNMDASDGVPLVELDSADIYGPGLFAQKEVAEKDGDLSVEMVTEVGQKDDIFLDMTEDAAVGKGPNANYGEMENNLETEIYNANTLEEQREMEFSHQVPEGMLEGFMNTYENPSDLEAYKSIVIDAETSGFDMHYPDGINYEGVGNDTEFLNVDDDELTEIADDHMPDDEETRYTENSGWSSRTRAVSKYLQTAFAKEAESGSNSLSMDKLLIGKSRKEASRMFFETLVLKTRDYIDVKQPNPYDDITIKPRMKLMKSDF